MNVLNFVKRFNHWKKFLVSATATIVLIPQSVYAIVVKTGDPVFPKDGSTTTVKYRIFCDPGGSFPPTSGDVSIQVNSNDTAIGKAIKLKSALDALDIHQRCKDGTVIEIPPGDIILDSEIVSIVKLAGDDSGQKDKFETGKGTKNKDAPKKVTIDTDLKFWPLSLSGVNLDGNESQFFASFGFNDGLNDYVATSNFTFSELPDNTIDSLLTLTYSNLLASLPVSFQSYLILDLDTYEITYNFPSNIVSAFVETQSDDTEGGYSQAIEIKTPEPTSTLSLLSLGILGAGATLKRKVKRSHSLEKEPNNVG
jgi:hypothetical protein